MSTAFGFNQVTVNGTVIPGQVSGSFDRREREDTRADDGQLHQTSSAVMRAAPRAEFQTVALKTLFTLLGTGDEIPFVALNGTTGIKMIGNKIAATGPGPAASTVHAQRAFLAGLLVLDGISWSPGGVASASASAYATTSAGGTDPVVSTNVAAGTPAVNVERHVLSVCTINGTAVPQVSSLSIQITHQIDNSDDSTCYDLGLPYPVICKEPGAGGATEVIATIETADLTTAFANGAFVATFAILNHNGVGTSAATATVTMNTCLVREQSISGSSGQPAGRRITCRATFDGTNKPITLATA